MTSKYLLIAVLFGAITLTGFASWAGNAPGITGVVYTANEKDGTISAIDFATGRVDNVAVQIMPHNVQISADGRRLYAVGMDMATTGASHKGAHGSAGGRLVILDSPDVARGPVAEIAIGPHPAHVVTSADGKFAYVTDSQENVVQVVDLTAMRILRAIPTGIYPHGLRASPDGRELYVANVKSGDLSIIDTATSMETTRIKVGRGPVQVGLTPDGEKIFVSLNGEDKVALIDRRTRKLLGKLSVGRNPVQVFATPDSKLLYVANQGTERKPDHTVSVIDIAASHVIATVTTGKGPHGVVVSNDGRFAFVSNIADNTVSAIDTMNQTVVGRLEVGAGPNGITFRDNLK